MSLKVRWNIQLVSAPENTIRMFTFYGLTFYSCSFYSSVISSCLCRTSSVKMKTDVAQQLNFPVSTIYFHFLDKKDPLAVPASSYLQIQTTYVLVINSRKLAVLRHSESVRWPKFCTFPVLFAATAARYITMCFFCWGRQSGAVMLPGDWFIFAGHQGIRHAAGNWFCCVV